jgi:hypothetical protein
MQQEARDPIALHYGQARRFSRWSGRFMWAFAVLLFLYSSTWLLAAWQADCGGYVTNLVGHNVRLAPHQNWPRAMRLLFEPAYRVDQWLRPSYWHWDGPFEF